MTESYQKTAAVFSCQGLGDGLIALVLSHNLALNGYTTTTFHPSLASLQSWLPTLSIATLPSNIEKQLHTFDRLFIFVEQTAPMISLLTHALKDHRDKTIILNPIATANQDYAYWEEGKFDGTKSFVDNLYTFSKQILKLPVCTKSNGITPPSSLQWQRHPKRILLHPTSSRAGKNWSAHKFLTLADALEKEGFVPQFILHPQERQAWNLSEQRAPLIADLPQLAALIYESGCLIGNDSGPGHLASCLRIPTLSLFRNEKTAQFWRPGWGHSQVICPPRWVPNFKGLRWRDKAWQQWISVAAVKRRFHKLCKLSHQ